MYEPVSLSCLCDFELDNSQLIAVQVFLLLVPQAISPWVF